MSDNQPLSDKEILDKFGKMIMELVHTKTCHNIQAILSGYSNPNTRNAELFLEYANLDDNAKKVTNKLLLHAVNNAIANFLFVLTDFDCLDEYRDTIAINTYYIDTNGNRKRIVKIYDNLMGLFSCDWIEQLATFKEEIAPENPRRIDFIKVFPTVKKNIDNTCQDEQQNLSQFDIENMIAKVIEETKKEMRYRLGSLYLIKYLTNRFLPNMKPEQWDEIEQIGNHDEERFSVMFDMAMNSQSLESYIEELRVHFGKK
jgi:hypothetical protein